MNDLDDEHHWGTNDDSLAQCLQRNLKMNQCKGKNNNTDDAIV